MGSGARMREQMERLLEELPQDKIDMARYDFDGPERTEWSYFPKEMIGSSFFGFSATMASVVTRMPATEAASCRAIRTTLVGSMMPDLSMSPYGSILPAN